MRTFSAFVNVYAVDAITAVSRVALTTKRAHIVGARTIIRTVVRTSPTLIDVFTGNTITGVTRIARTTE